MEHNEGHRGLRASRTPVQAHLDACGGEQGVSARLEARMSRAARTQPHDACAAAVGLGSATSFSQRKREAEKDTADATVVQGGSGRRGTWTQLNCYHGGNSTL